MMKRLMKSRVRFTYPWLILLVILGISSCASTPNSQGSNSQDSESPAIGNNIPNRVLDNRSESTRKNLDADKIGQDNNIEDNSLSSKPKPKPNNIKPNKDKVAVAPTDIIGRTLGVTMYTSDPQCTKLVPKKVQVSAAKPAENIVGQVLQQQDSGDFELKGYRVNIKDNVATVDLRVAPESKRQVSSLSSCEQFALFNSLKKTLTSNSQLNIKDVKFTEKGEEILF